MALGLKPVGLSFGEKDTTYFLGRERVLSSEEGGMPRWRRALFGFLSRNSTSATEFFQIPPERVVELGSHVAV